jgi:hypothetical protein
VTRREWKQWLLMVFLLFDEHDVYFFRVCGPRSRCVDISLVIVAVVKQFGVPVSGRRTSGTRDDEVEVEVEVEVTR